VLGSNDTIEACRHAIAYESADYPAFAPTSSKLGTPPAKRRKKRKSLS
jgi:hypothetical protein